MSRGVAIVLTLVVSLANQAAHAATISGPSTSTDGTFTLTWPTGYKLRTVNGSWQFPNGTSQAFTALPSGDYKFRLYTCWQENEPGAPTVTLCAADPGSDKTVTVTRDVEASIEATSVAGTTPYQADVSLRGSARIEVPIQTLPGINGFVPALALRYDSARKGDVTDFYTADDTLGYGWHLAGASVISTCRGGLSGSPEPILNGTDRYCLDGTPLLPIGGNEYRTEQQSFIKVIKQSTWFEVRYPDGRVATYGDTADSQVVASGRFSTQTTSGFLGPNPTYLWAIRQVTNGFGDTMTYAYDRFDPYGMVQLKSISYGGATVDKHPTNLPLSNDDARMVWEKLKAIGKEPRLDPGHKGRKWDMPHINVDGTHIPVSPDFTVTSGFLVVLFPNAGTRYSGVDRVPAFPSQIPGEQEAMDRYVFGNIKDYESNLIPTLQSALELKRSLCRGGRDYEIIHCTTSSNEDLYAHLQVRATERLGFDVAAIRSDYWSVVDDFPPDEWARPYDGILNANGLFEARQEAEKYLNEYRKQGVDADSPLEVVCVTRIVAS